MLQPHEGAVITAPILQMRNRGADRSRDSPRVSPASGRVGILALESGVWATAHVSTIVCVRERVHTLSGIVSES